MGLLDDVRLFSSALSSEEIGSLYGRYVANVPQRPTWTHDHFIITVVVVVVVVVSILTFFYRAPEYPPPSAPAVPRASRPIKHLAELVNWQPGADPLNVSHVALRSRPHIDDALHRQQRYCATSSTHDLHIH
jgi:hypothetical protein